ncbi:MAG: hypothetical protein WCE75_10810 [Terracidiphilus sp.]
MAEHAKYVLEEGAREVGPRLRPTGAFGPVPWQLKWAVLFRDGLYAQATENYILTKFSGLGERKDFAFHYGQTPATFYPDGFPDYRKSGCSAIIRIDNHSPYDPLSGGGPHMHYNGEDHIGQSRVNGLDILNSDLFHFMDAVSEHRKTGRAFHEILNFTVQP